MKQFLNVEMDTMIGTTNDDGGWILMACDAVFANSERQIEILLHKLSIFPIFPAILPIAVVVVIANALLHKRKTLIQMLNGKTEFAIRITLDVPMAVYKSEDRNT